MYACNAGPWVSYGVPKLRVTHPKPYPWVTVYSPSMTHAEEEPATMELEVIIPDGVTGLSTIL